jgi:hypothetical protein
MSGTGTFSSDKRGGGVTPHTLVMLVAIGMALNAIWVHVRFPSLAPQTLRAGILHMIAALVLLELAPVAIRLGLASNEQLMVALVGVAFPALTYVFLASLWMIRLFHGMMTRGVR